MQRDQGHLYATSRFGLLGPYPARTIIRDSRKVAGIVSTLTSRGDSQAETCRTSTSSFKRTKPNRNWTR